MLDVVDKSCKQIDEKGFTAQTSDMKYIIQWEMILSTTCREGTVKEEDAMDIDK